MKNSFTYHFERIIGRTTWTADILSDGDMTDIEISRGATPHWHNFDNGTSLWEPTGSIWSGFRCTRIQALRFVACALTNLHGFSMSNGGNDPQRPVRTHKPSKMRTFKETNGAHGRGRISYQTT